MRILYLTNKPIYPVVDGGCRAMERMLDCFYEQAYSLKHLCISTEKHPFKKDAYPNKIKDPESVFISTKLSPSHAFVDLMKGRSYHISRFISEDLQKRIIEVIHDFQPDIVFLESLFLAPNIESIRQNTKAPIVIRTHNVEHNLWARIAQKNQNPLKKWYLQKLSAQLKKYEISSLNKVNGLAVISKNDLEIFKMLGIQTKMDVIPIALPKQNKRNENSATTFFHLGSMNWQPNIDAVNELLSTIFPALQKEIPDARLLIAGSFMPENIAKNKQKGVEILGFVKDPSNLYLHDGIFISPIRSGSGVRVKLLEAMQAGVPVITTQQGAEGIDSLDGIVIAESTNDFVRSAVELFHNKPLRKDIGTKGAENILNNYSIQAISKKLNDFLRSI